ncbi:MAG: AIR synthase-related protein, partial [Pseudomonadota bacterium]|nr:AIR synthase-related protein [Pseudomonadota bacterium]
FAADLSARIDLSAWPVPPVFGWLARAGGIAPLEMLRTFNCGIGMVAAVPPAEAPAVTAALTAAGERVYRIGTLEARGADMAPVIFDNMTTSWPI